tara:strand:+ start:316 stop:663 length:348 start_codon:yes stop_codon:yes gene_type:complete
MLIYKIFLPDQWKDFTNDGRTKGARVDISDGYIHFSTATQVKETITKHFSGYKDVVLAACKADTFSTDLKWELSRGGQDFPHLYRELLMTDIEWHSHIKQKNGEYPLPENINEPI